jgi:3-phytase
VKRTGALLLLTLVALAATITPLTPTRGTEAFAFDPDDPAIWVNPKQPSASLIIGTMKVAAPDGGLGVFTLDGKRKQMVQPIDRPNNVDVEYGLLLGGRKVDIAVATERNRQCLRIFAVDANGLRDLAPEGLPVFAGQTGQQQLPMGIGLYKRKKDGAIFAIVSRKSGPRSGYLWQYRIDDDGSGKPRATKVREFGAFSGVGEIEPVLVDDELGYVYYSDEGAGIHKYHADPDHTAANDELALFAREGFRGDREGIALWIGPRGTGYLVATDQLPGISEYHLYPRAGEPGQPHQHDRRIASFSANATVTDGIEVISTPLGPEFPRGMMVAMNEAGRNFVLLDWRRVLPLLK